MTDFALEPADQYLTRQELIALTGWTHKLKQQRWLKAEKWPYEISGRGRILVSRDYHNARMHGRKDFSAVTAFATNSHNFAALR